MSAQLPLVFDARRLSRRRDPASSKRAAAKVAGSLQCQAAEVLRIVLAHPGRTSKELGALGFDRFKIARRAPELEAGDWITRWPREEGGDLALWPTQRARDFVGETSP